MNSNEPPTDAVPSLQFSTVENLDSKPTENALTCVSCKKPISDTYFALADQVLCEACCVTIKKPPSGSGTLVFAKTALAGTIAGLGGALIWYGIRVALHLEIGIIAILVGFMVGKTIHRFSRDRGGLAYQILAVAITYSCICVNYMPDLVSSFYHSMEDSKKDRAMAKEAPAGEGDAAATSKEDEGVIAIDPEKASPSRTESEEPRTAIGLVLSLLIFMVIVFVVSLTVPVMMGFQSPIGLLIIGFALWEAWKFTAYRPLPITGPYQFGSQSHVSTS